ncbi:hypothetical protein [Elizabethkingia sp. JS20170427COW]|uniref:hypothetical protein n=1 Tax=Elizabethkingia sp. JS20170427COW TaxID=2583851 RepID=UPI001110E11F|nr:hypothetical protein [Elizabethkingia sp. JS20170427COW]QCX52400.1 hypothetical protein FGE20_00860 [Elizabethkingia sp. JS20170427COW]
MRNIAYIELDTHAELASGFMELMRDSKNFHVDYYFSEKIVMRISKHKNTIHLTSPESLLKDLENKHYDFVILGTAHRYFNIFEQLTSLFPTYIIAHNLNFIKAPTSDIVRSILKKDRIFRLKLLLKEGLLKKNKVYENAKALLVLNENILDYQNNPRLKLLPLFFTEYQNPEPNPLQVAIPGAVKQHRRNYKRIFNKIKSFQHPFSFYFLGKAEGKELEGLQLLKKQLPKHLFIQYYDEHVSGNEFNQHIRNASVLWCPIQESTYFFGIKEIYGKTKISGNVGDAIKYATPIILPKTYSSYYSFIFKEEKDIESQILSIKDKVYDFENFNKIIVKEQLELALLELTFHTTSN